MLSGGMLVVVQQALAWIVLASRPCCPVRAQRIGTMQTQHITTQHITRQQNTAQDDRSTACRLRLHTCCQHHRQECSIQGANVCRLARKQVVQAEECCVQDEEDRLLI